jgi:hypothetical protein
VPTLVRWSAVFSWAWIGEGRPSSSILASRQPAAGDFVETLEGLFIGELVAMVGDERAEKIQAAVEAMHKVKATHYSSRATLETFRDKVVDR